MRTSIALLLLLCLSAPSLSQAPRGEVAPVDPAFDTVYAHRSIPIVTGRLLNLTAAELQKTVISYSLVTPFAQFQVKKTVVPQSDGSFRLALDYAFPYQQIWLSVGDFFYAALYANSDLFLELDMQKIRTAREMEYNGPGVHYLGKDGPMNAYLNNYMLYKRSEQLKLSDSINSIWTRVRPIAGAKLLEYDRLYDSVKRIENSYIVAHPSPYEWLIRNEQLSDYYGQLLFSYTGKVLDDAMWKEISGHKSYLTSNSSYTFYNAMSYYISYFPGDKHPAPMTDRAIRRMDSMLPAATADFLKLRLTYSTDLKERALAWEHILHTMHAAWAISVAKQEYRHIEDNISVVNAALARSVSTSDAGSLGKPLFETPFGATLYKVSGLPVSDLLTRLRQSFPGKAILIDRWATWCLPCLSEMPHSKRLEQESKDLPVVFVYLCTLYHSSEDKWKSKVIELQQPGIHILIDEKLDAELSTYFSFSGYPGYAYIDKNGKYKGVDMQNMSDMNIQTLTALLGSTP